MRVSLRDELLQSLGMIAAPIKNAADFGTLSPPEAAVLRAKANRDVESFRQLAEAYCKVGDLFLQEEFNWIMTEAQKVANYTGALLYPESRAEVLTNLPRQLTAVRERINNVPVDLPEDILSLTPFRIFLKLRAIISAAQHRVELFDPYIDASVFYRYLAEVDQEVEITVVTTSKRLKGGWSETERERLLDVSTLFACERTSLFRLLVLDELHDRHIRVDSMAMHLGGSIKDAGRNAPFTISRMAAQADDALDALLGIAKPWSHGS